MAEIGSESNPLRVAIIGAGPTGFYAAGHLFKHEKLTIEVDMYDRLPTPFGLVRGGVAPDHQKIKSVTKAYDRIADRTSFRFYGYVEFGTDVTLDDLKKHYHQILFSTGAQTDRSLGIPGENLEGSHAATEFVAWYNGHPDYRDRKFDLSQERAAVVGIGNVAVDVARILCRTPEELAETDIADIVVLPEEAELDALSKQSVEEDKSTTRKVEILQEYAARKGSGKPRRLILRFLVSPVELIGNDAGEVSGMKIVKNELYATETGTLRPRETETFEELPVGLVFRSVGYRGVPLPGVPFQEKWGAILNEKGRVIEPESKKPVTGLYTAGWIKRGPSGVIGTNKPDALETVNCMMEDLANGSTLEPSEPDPAAAETLVRERKPNFVSWKDWQKLNEIEVGKGHEEGRPRVKFTTVEDMLAALGR